MTIKSQSAKTSAQKRIHVNSDNVRYSNDSIFSLFSYHHNHVTEKSEQIEIEPKIANFVIRTKRKVPRTGLMLVGLGGNNGSTVAAGIIANRRNLSWKSRRGVHNANYLGSLTQSATLKMGDANGREKYFPFKRVLPLLNPDDLVVSGWDISGADLKTAMERAQVLPLGLQNRLSEEMAGIKPLPSVYYPDFIAANQNERADNLLEGSRASLLHLEKIRRDIRLFKEKEKLEKVIVLWTANTERFCEVTEGVHDTEQSFMKALKEGHSEISPSQVL
ncbi:Myo-inositol-1-phosphate synthase [Bonamia ostreae]|uniref:Myo-inositol-1-phosphate synthase n=1 Tax=Bonamia ostreae TaxID=126728 RepID=A0ABV2ATA5_9EUKA